MKKHTISLILLIGIALLGTFFYQEHGVITTKSFKQDGNIEKLGSFGVDFNLVKTNHEGDYLPGGRFQLYTYYDYYRTDDFYQSEPGVYGVSEYVSGPGYYQDAYRSLSLDQKNFVNSIHTLQQIMDFNANEEYDYCFSTSMFSSVNMGGVEQANAASLPSVSANKIGRYCYINLPTVWVLDEVKAPTGYAKEKILYPGVITVEYTRVDYEEVFTASENSPDATLSSVKAAADERVELSGIQFNGANGEYAIRYGNVGVETLMGTDMETAASVWLQNNDNTVCITTELMGRSDASIPKVGGRSSLVDSVYYSSAYGCLEDKQGTPQVEINSSVNNVSSLMTSTNQNLEYKVVVKNTGPIDSVDNVIRSTLPEGFVYVDGTANHGGYLSNGAIEWEVGRIPAGQTLELTYKAYAPKGINEAQDYIGNASMESSTIDNPIQSNKTMVRLSLDNPKTYGTLQIIIVILLISAWTAYFVTRLNKQQQNQG